MSPLGASEVGYKLGHHTIIGDDVLRTQVCCAMVKILEDQDLSERIIPQILYTLS